VIGWQPANEGGALTGTPNEDARLKYIKYDWIGSSADIQPLTQN